MLIDTIKKDASRNQKSRRSRVPRFCADRSTVFLSLLILILIVTLAFVLGFITVPRFEDKSSPDTSPQFAVIPHNFPDPSFVGSWTDGKYYAFATRNAGINVQVAIGTNISTWALQEDDALPHPGPWTAASLNDTQVWAPSVVITLSGSYVMFYSALARNQTRKHCIGAATADWITGPYTPFSEPIICDFEHGGVIDPAYFHDPGTNTSYLIYKQDGNAIGIGGDCSNGGAWPNTPTPLMAIELDPKELLTPVERPFQLLTNLQADGPNIESPTMYYYDYVGSNGTDIRSYHLLYNSGCFHDASYRIMHVVCIPESEEAWLNKGIKGCTWAANRQKAAECLANINAEGCGTVLATTLLDSFHEVPIVASNLSAMSDFDTNNDFIRSDTRIKLTAPGGPAIVSNPSKYCDPSIC